MRVFTLLFLMLLFAVKAHAGFGGMGNVDTESGGALGLPVFVAIGCIAGLIATLVKPNLNLMPCMVLGGGAGLVVEVLVRVVS